MRRNTLQIASQNVSRNIIRSDVFGEEIKGLCLTYDRTVEIKIHDGEKINFSIFVGDKSKITNLGGLENDRGGKLQSD